MRLPILILHITAGIMGLISGTVAMSLRKGSRGHRTSGNVFVVSMLIMGACGSYLAILKHQTGNIFGGLLTVYLVSTAWLTGRRRDPGLFDWTAFAMAIGVGGTLLVLGTKIATGHGELQAGVPLGMYFVMGSIPLIAAAGDLRMLLRGGIFGTARLSRHLWRMCFGLFIATGSFFLGQQQVIPEPFRQQFLLVPLALAPLALLIFWMIRVRVSMGFKKMNPAHTTPRVRVLIGGQKQTCR